jgi:bifunctional non-homologous end joining protein LigD
VKYATAFWCSARGNRVRLLTRNGHDWSNRYPLIVEAALRNRQSSFVIDGEAVLLGVDGVSDFNGLHSRKYNEHVQLYAFDVLASVGTTCARPLIDAQNILGTTASAPADGIFVAPFETGEIEFDLFRAACNFGLEGLRSKRRDIVYRSGRSPSWVTMKNRSHPAIQRVKDAFA